jgi:hypothetical protein
MNNSSIDGYNPNGDKVLSMPTDDYPYLRDEMPSKSDINNLKVTDQLAINSTDHYVNRDMSSGYESTGNNVGLKMDEVENIFNYIHKLCEEWDNKLSNFNPYAQVIIYKTSDDKVIQVPASIHKKALDIWSQNNRIENTVEEPKVVYLEPEKQDSKINYFFIVILVALALLYFYRKKLNIGF